MAGYLETYKTSDDSALRTEISAFGGVEMIFEKTLHGRAPHLKAKEIKIKARDIEMEQEFLTHQTESVEKSGGGLFGRKKEKKTIERRTTAMVPIYDIQKMTFETENLNRHVGAEFNGEALLKSQAGKVKVEMAREHVSRYTQKSSSNIAW